MMYTSNDFMKTNHNNNEIKDTSNDAIQFSNRTVVINNMVGRRRRKTVSKERRNSMLDRANEGNVYANDYVSQDSNVHQPSYVGTQTVHSSDYTSNHPTDKRIVTGKRASHMVGRGPDHVMTMPVLLSPTPNSPIYSMCISTDSVITAHANGVRMYRMHAKPSPKTDKTSVGSSLGLSMLYSSSSKALEMIAGSSNTLPQAQGDQTPASVLQSSSSNNGRSQVRLPTEHATAATTTSRLANNEGSTDNTHSGGKRVHLTDNPTIGGGTWLEAADTYLGALRGLKDAWGQQKTEYPKKSQPLKPPVTSKGPLSQAADALFTANEGAINNVNKEDDASSSEDTVSITPTNVDANSYNDNMDDDNFLPVFEEYSFRQDPPLLNSYLVESLSPWYSDRCSVALRRYVAVASGDLPSGHTVSIISSGGPKFCISHCSQHGNVKVTCINIAVTFNYSRVIVVSGNSIGKVVLSDIDKTFTVVEEQNPPRKVERLVIGDGDDNNILPVVVCSSIVSTETSSRACRADGAGEGSKRDGESLIASASFLSVVSSEIFVHRVLIPSGRSVMNCSLVSSRLLSCDVLKRPPLLSRYTARLLSPSGQTVCPLQSNFDNSDKTTLAHEDNEAATEGMGGCGIVLIEALGCILVPRPRLRFWACSSETGLFLGEDMELVNRLGDGGIPWPLRGSSVSSRSSKDISPRVHTSRHRCQYSQAIKPSKQYRNSISDDQNDVSDMWVLESVVLPANFTEVYESRCKQVLQCHSVSAGSSVLPSEGTTVLPKQILQKVYMLLKVSDGTVVLAKLTISMEQHTEMVQEWLASDDCHDSTVTSSGGSNFKNTKTAPPSLFSSSTNKTTKRCVVMEMINIVFKPKNNGPSFNHEELVCPSTVMYDPMSHSAVLFFGGVHQSGDYMNVRKVSLLPPLGRDCWHYGLSQEHSCTVSQIQSPTAARGCHMDSEGGGGFGPIPEVIPDTSNAVPVVGECETVSPKKPSSAPHSKGVNGQKSDKRNSVKDVSQEGVSRSFLKTMFTAIADLSTTNEGSSSLSESQQRVSLMDRRRDGNEKRATLKQSTHLVTAGENGNKINVGADSANQVFNGVIKNPSHNLQNNSSQNLPFQPSPSTITSVVSTPLKEQSNVNKYPIDSPHATRRNKIRIVSNVVKGKSFSNLSPLKTTPSGVELGNVAVKSPEASKHRNNYNTSPVTTRPMRGMNGIAFTASSLILGNSSDDNHEDPFWVLQPRKRPPTPPTPEIIRMERDRAVFESQQRLDDLMKDNSECTMDQDVLGDISQGDREKREAAFQKQLILLEEMDHVVFSDEPADRTFIEKAWISELIMTIVTIYGKPSASAVRAQQRMDAAPKLFRCSSPNTKSTIGEWPSSRSKVLVSDAHESCLVAINGGSCGCSYGSPVYPLSSLLRSYELRFIMDDIDNLVNLTSLRFLLSYHSIMRPDIKGDPIRFLGSAYGREYLRSERYRLLGGSGVAMIEKAKQQDHMSMDTDGRLPRIQEREFDSNDDASYDSDSCLLTSSSQISVLESRKAPVILLPLTINRIQSKPYIAFIKKLQGNDCILFEMASVRIKYEEQIRALERVETVVILENWRRRPIRKTSIKRDKSFTQGTVEDTIARKASAMMYEWVPHNTIQYQDLSGDPVDWISLNSKYTKGEALDSSMTWASTETSNIHYYSNTSSTLPSHRRNSLYYLRDDDQGLRESYNSTEYDKVRQPLVSLEQRRRFLWKTDPPNELTSDGMLAGNNNNNVRSIGGSDLNDVNLYSKYWRGTTWRFASYFPPMTDIEASSYCDNNNNNKSMDDDIEIHNNKNKCDTVHCEDEVDIRITASIAPPWCSISDIETELAASLANDVTSDTETVSSCRHDCGSVSGASRGRRGDTSMRNSTSPSRGPSLFSYEDIPDNYKVARRVLIRDRVECRDWKKRRRLEKELTSILMGLEKALDPF